MSPIVIRSIPDPVIAWRWVDQDDNTIGRLELDDDGRLVPAPRVAVNPSNYELITTADPFLLEDHEISIVGDRLTVTEPDGTRWLWILEPAVWEGNPGYFIGRWPD